MKKVFIFAVLLLLIQNCSFYITPSNLIKNFTIARVEVKSSTGLSYGSAVPIKYTSSNTVYFLTCKHVIGKKEVNEINLTLYSNAIEYGTINNVKVAYSNDALDLAIIEAPKVLPIVCSCMYSAGLESLQAIYSIACPLGEDPVFSRGIITIQRDRMVSTAVVVPGCSGGGIYDANTGELVGISTAVYFYEQTFFDSINIFIPISSIKLWMQEVNVI